MTQRNTALAIAALKDLLGDRLSTGESIREGRGRDEAYSQPALPDAVACPQRTDGVCAIVKICAQHKVPVVP
ncbi:MAG: FAD-binding oxidoreductase, partial [Sedimentitalea sp.]